MIQSVPGYPFPYSRHSVSGQILVENRVTRPKQRRVENKTRKKAPETFSIFWEGRPFEVHPPTVVGWNLHYFGLSPSCAVAFYPHRGVYGTSSAFPCPLHTKKNKAQKNGRVAIPPVAIRAGIGGCFRCPMGSAGLRQHRRIVTCRSRLAVVTVATSSGNEIIAWRVEKTWQSTILVLEPGRR